MTQATTDSIRDYIYSELTDLGVEQDALVGTTTFDDLDVDSLDIADLMMSVKKKYGVDVPRRDLIGLKLDDLVARVAAGQA